MSCQYLIPQLDLELHRKFCYDFEIVLHMKANMQLPMSKRKKFDGRAILPTSLECFLPKDSILLFLLEATQVNGLECPLVTS
jgi:hypothetical protein